MEQGSILCGPDTKENDMKRWLFINVWQLLFWSRECRRMWAQGQIDHWEFMKKLPAMEDRMRAILAKPRRRLVR